MVEIELKTNVKVEVSGEPAQRLRAGVVRVSKAIGSHLVSAGLAEEIQRAEPAPTPAVEAESKPSPKAKTRKKRRGAELE